jgi:hypothetical protein
VVAGTRLSSRSPPNINQEIASMTRLLALAFFALATAWAPLAQAQSITPPPAQAASDFPDSDLKSFASALVEVSRINDTYMPVYHAAKTPQEQEAVEKKASEEMVKAVENSGMSVAKYHEILGAARSNPEVANRIHEHVKDAASR